MICVGGRERMWDEGKHISPTATFCGEWVENRRRQWNMKFASYALLVSMFDRPDRDSIAAKSPRTLRPNHWGENLEIMLLWLLSLPLFVVVSSRSVHVVIILGLNKRGRNQIRPSVDKKIGQKTRYCVLLLVWSRVADATIPGMQFQCKNSVFHEWSETVCYSHRRADGTTEKINLEFFDPFAYLASPLAVNVE